MQLSKLGGGVSLNLSKLRAKGEAIKDVENATKGVVGVMKLLDNAFRYADQMGQRQGSGAAYLNIFHRDIFLAASGIMAPFESNDVLQVVTAVWVESDGSTEVIWTRQYQGENYTNVTPHTVGSAYALPDAMIDISRGNMVIAAEASYSYTPLQGLIFDAPVNLYRSAYFLPRFGEPISIN